MTNRRDTSEDHRRDRSDLRVSVCLGRVVRPARSCSRASDRARPSGVLSARRFCGHLAHSGPDHSSDGYARSFAGARSIVHRSSCEP